MKTPFTVDQFFNVFKTYNETVFPSQFLFYFLAGIAIYLIFRYKPSGGKIISGILSFFWLWMGIVYHLIFFTSINKAAYAFGALYIVQGFLFLIVGVFQNRLSFRFHPGMHGITGFILVVYSLILYPVFGYLQGHVYPASPTFGLPCPTTIFTFGMLLMLDNRCPVIIMIIPFLWSLVGFTAAFQFGVVEDTGLLIAGLVAVTMVLLRNRKMAAGLHANSADGVSH